MKAITASFDVVHHVDDVRALLCIGSAVDSQITILDTDVLQRSADSTVTSFTEQLDQYKALLAQSLVKDGMVMAEALEEAMHKMITEYEYNAPRHREPNVVVDSVKVKGKVIRDLRPNDIRVAMAFKNKRGGRKR